MLSKKKTETRTLEYFCQNNFSLKTKIALLSFYKIRYSDWTEKIIILFEYLQLITQALTVFFKVENDEKTSPHSSLTHFVFYFFKIINPADLLDYHTTNALTDFSITVVFCYTFFKLLLFVSVVFVALSGKYDTNSFLLQLWQWIFKLQGRVAYFFGTWFWVRAAMNSYSWFGMGEGSTTSIACLMIAVELAFSFFLETQFCYVLPTKNFLASKSPEIPLLTLSQKFIIQILIMGIRSYFSTTAWITASVNLLFSITRIYRYYATLPYYKLEALLLQGSLLSIVTAMNFACLAQIIAWTTKDHNNDINLVVIVWIILGILMVKVFQDIGKQILINLFTKKSKKGYSCEVLLHKLALFRQINKDERLPDVQTETYDFIHLLNTSLTQNLQWVFDLKEPQYSTFLSSTNRKEFIKRTSLAYLDNLSEKAPKNTLVKLIKARTYAKCPELYATAIRIAASLKEKYWSQNYVTSCFLLYEIQKTILSDYENSETNLSLLPFTESKVRIDKLKNKIMETNEHKITICNSILGDICNIGTIFNSSQKIHDNVADITKQIEAIAKNLPDGYVSPLLIFAEFHVLINYSIKDFRRFHDLYFQKFFKCERQFLDRNLLQENLYQEENAFLVLSGEKNRTGQIIYCSDSTENLFGQDKKALINSHILDLVPHCFRAHYEGVFRQIFETGDQSLIQRTFKTFMLNKNKCLVEVEFFLRIHPYITQSLCLQMLIRPTPSEGDYLLLRKDGNLEGGTEKISRILGIDASSSNINIRTFSEHLFKANKAFNRVHRGENSSPKTAEISYEEARIIFDNYTQKGKKVELRVRNNNVRTYFCKISILAFGELLMKLVHLQEVNEFEEATCEKVPHQEEDGCSENIECYEREMEYYQPGSSKRETSLMLAFKELASARIAGTTQADAHLISARSRGNLISPSSVDSDFLTNIENNFSGQEVRKAQAQYLSSSSNAKSSDVGDYKFLKSSIKSKSYPRSFNFLCLSFYAVILFTFLSQIVIKVVTDSTMADLVIKKNLLKNTEVFSYKSQQAYTNAVAGVLVIDGVYMVTQQARGLQSAIKSLKELVVSIEEARVAITLGITSLEDQFPNLTSVHDVKIIGSYYDSEGDDQRYLNIYQAAEAIENAIRYLSDLPDYSSQQAFEAFAFIARNVMDSYLLKCNDLTRHFIQSVEDQKLHFQSVVKLCLLITPLTLMGITVLLVLIIWRQYVLGRNYMITFTKLKPKDVKEIQTSLLNFRKNLQNEGQTTQYYMKHFADSSTQTGRERDQSYSAPNKNQVVEYKSYSVRYIGYVKRVIIYLASLIAIMIWNYITTEHSTKIIYAKQNQLEFANYISERISVGYAALNALFVTNNAWPVEGGPARDAMVQGVTEAKDIQEQIASVFLNPDGTYDPEIQWVLFGNYDCSAELPSFALYQCQTLAAKGTPVNLMTTISGYSTMLANKISDYDDCDKSTLKSRITAAYLNLDTLLPKYSISTGEALLVADFIDMRLTEYIGEAKHTRSVILCVFLICLVVVNIFIWLDILTRLKEVDNDFKKVLQTFPPRVILSSFLLKKFLFETTHSSLFGKK